LNIALQGALIVGSQSLGFVPTDDVLKFIKPMMKDSQLGQDYVNSAPNVANLYNTSPERELFVSLVFAVTGITTRTGNLGAKMTSASLVVRYLNI